MFFSTFFQLSKSFAYLFIVIHLMTFISNWVKKYIYMYLHINIFTHTRITILHSTCIIYCIVRQECIQMGPSETKLLWGLRSSWDNTMVLRNHVLRFYLKIKNFLDNKEDCDERSCIRGDPALEKYSVQSVMCSLYRPALWLPPVHARGLNATKSWLSSSDITPSKFLLIDSKQASSDLREGKRKYLM